MPDDLESRQASLEATQAHEALSPLRAPGDKAAPPPPFEDLPERPLFAGTERRAPRERPASAAGTSLGGGSATGETALGVDELGPEPGGTDGTGFWPFVDENDDRNDVHTGTEGRGWLRMAVIIAVLLAVVVAMAYAFNRGRQDGGNTSSGTSPTSSAQAAGGTKIAVARATDFDPLGDDSENPGEVGNVIDGDPSTTWTTSTYYNNPALGGLKAGVGVHARPGPRPYGEVDLDPAEGAAHRHRDVRRPGRCDPGTRPARASSTGSARASPRPRAPRSGSTTAPARATCWSG